MSMKARPLKGSLWIERACHHRGVVWMTGASEVVPIALLAAQRCWTVAVLMRSPRRGEAPETAQMNVLPCVCLKPRCTHVFRRVGCNRCCADFEYPSGCDCFGHLRWPAPASDTRAAAEPSTRFPPAGGSATGPACNTGEAGSPNTPSTSAPIPPPSARSTRTPRCGCWRCRLRWPGNCSNHLNNNQPCSRCLEACS